MSAESGEPVASEGAVTSLVWDWPLRIWHWSLVLTIGGSLYTGLGDDVALMDWHMRLGYVALGLILFRLLWACWGGAYARFGRYRTSPRRVLAYFRGRLPPDPHTAPGAALAVVLVLLVALQATSGLFTSDEIFTEGPLVRHASGSVVDWMSWLHHQGFVLILVAVAVHLSAHLVYAARGDLTPLSMFSGRKPVLVAATRHHPVRALLTAAAVIAAVYLGIEAA
ncbi:MAG: cytochrome b/b6 domain-containing protein [Pseudomonadales bacterium]